MQTNRMLVAGLAATMLALGAARASAQVVDTTKLGAAPDSTLLKPEIIDGGRKIFHGRGTCLACHGDKLQGGPIAPALVGPNWRHIDGTFAAMVNRITNGLQGTVMPARPGGISEQQVLMVATYVYAVSHLHAVP